MELTLSGMASMDSKKLAKTVKPATEGNYSSTNPPATSFFPDSSAFRLDKAGAKAHLPRPDISGTLITNNQRISHAWSDS
jgi:hypothetical protein